MTHLLQTIEHETAADPRWSVIWLHGLGADGSDFVPIVPHLLRKGWPAIRFVFPHAPVRAVTVNRGMRMRAWYDITGVDIASRQDEPGIRQSIADVEALIAREGERGVPAARVFLAGFSQGGAIALSAGLRHTERLAGIVALSTYLPLADLAEAERHGANHDLPIFMGHGSQDPVVPMALGEMSRKRLEAFGHPVQWRSYPMPHSVSADEIADIAGWMTARLSG